MVRALLFSNSTNHGGRYLAHGLAELLDFLGPVRTLLFAPFALKDRAGYTEKVRTALSEHGLTVVELTADGSGPARCARGGRALFVGGGKPSGLATFQESDLLAPAGAGLSPACLSAAARAPT